MKNNLNNKITLSNKAHKNLSKVSFDKNNKSMQKTKKENIVALTKYVYHENVIDNQSRKRRLLNKREKEELYIESASAVSSTLFK